MARYGRVAPRVVLPAFASRGSLSCPMRPVGSGYQAGVGLGSAGREVQPVPEVFGVPGARGVPVDEHGLVRVARDSIRKHLVVRRPLVSVRHRRVYYENLSCAREDFHHLVELLVGDDAIVAHVDDHHLPELVGSTKLT